MEIDKSNTTAYGKYLVTLGSCSDCHTQADKGEPLPGMYLAGGMEFIFPSGIVRSLNITTDEETGIGKWTKEDFIKRFRNYGTEEAKNIPVDMNKDFNTPMPWLMYTGMTDEDLGAIYEYLRTVSPVKNKVERFTPGSIATASN